jgi:hypothetical protein
MERSVIATRDNFDERFPDDEQERFWALVRNTLRLFDAEPARAVKYRDALKGARVGERIAVYHTSPLSIAADLVGWYEPIPPEMLHRYLELQRQTYASEFDKLPPNP